MQQATLAGGCFWCLEAVYQEVKGVLSVVSGYSGGMADNPSYQQVHYTNSGEAEAVQISFDPDVISYHELLEIFFFSHDPTTPNRQGNDTGPEYRSVIFYHNESQRQTAETVIRTFAAKLWDRPVITEITRFERFWPAEDYHQNFYANNPSQGYCQVIINPKLQKFRAKFRSKLK